MKLETRYACPVCIGPRMEKVSVAGIVLDHCPRCGGVWFGEGEVQRLRLRDAALLWREIVQRDHAHVMRCHCCRAHMQRNAEECEACGWQLELDCPVCDRPMPTSRQGDLVLDYCKGCRGVWFDHDELTGIWKLEANALARRRHARSLDGAGDLMLLDVLYVDPFFVAQGVHVTGQAGGALGEAVAGSGAFEVAGQMAEAAGDVASSLFETIVGIIGGLFG